MSKFVCLHGFLLCCRRSCSSYGKKRSSYVASVESSWHWELRTPRSPTKKGNSGPWGNREKTIEKFGKPLEYLEKAIEHHRTRRNGSRSVQNWRVFFRVSSDVFKFQGFLKNMEIRNLQSERFISTAVSKG